MHAAFMLDKTLGYPELRYIMKKKYVSPEIKLIELQTENLMALSSVNVNSYNGKSDSDINEDINPWDGEEGEY